MKRWYVVSTQSRGEEKAAFHLRRQGFEIYLPRYLKRRSHARRIDWLPAPMFPRYLFTQYNAEKNNWVHVKSTRGVSHVITFGENLTEVPNSVIDYLKSKVDDNDVLKLQTTRKTFQKGDELVIKQGVFQGKDATFLSMSGKERVRVLLSLMNQITIADISEQNLERKAIVETFSL